jgi:hypothetical protein
LHFNRIGKIGGLNPAFGFDLATQCFDAVIEFVLCHGDVPFREE